MNTPVHISLFPRFVSWIRSLVLTLAILPALCPPPAAHAQGGSLTPPGPPGPTMKSLDQIESRTPIESLPFTISAPGSYYLTKNLSVTSGNGITINSGDVSVDLNGFTISSSEATPAGTGILINGNNVSIRNGTVRGNVDNTGGPLSGSGFLHGVGTSPSFFGIHNVHVSHVLVSGCMGDGISRSAAGLTSVENCTVRMVRGSGIVGSTIQNSTASDCGISGISGVNVINCNANSLSGNAIFARTATNCKGVAESTSLPGANGISADCATNCVGENFGSGVGISATTVRDCKAFSTSGKAIVAKVVDGCHAVTTGAGQTAIEARIVTNSSAETPSGTAILATIVANSYGETTGGEIGIQATNVSNSHGLTATGTFGIFASTVSNSYGKTSGSGASASGINAFAGVVHNSFGESTNTVTNSIGIFAQTASYSRGRGKFGIVGQIVIGSLGIPIGSGGTPITGGQQFLPP
jgi:hypothetical protein